MEVNGKPVKTLDDLRKALLSGACDQFLTVKTEDNVFVVFPMARVLEEEERFAIDYRYPLSPTIQQMLGMTAMPKK